MKNVNYLSVAEEVIKQIKSQGAFLVAKSKDDKKNKCYDYWLGCYWIYVEKADNDSYG